MSIRAYQSFPWQPGASHSPAKLASLHLPALAGKSVLDVGCNTGFFCGFASWQGAREVTGVDSDAEAIRTARELFPACNFIRKDWKSLSPEKYDVILFLSAIHYARDQVAMLDFLMKKLNPRGMLCLEIGVAPGTEKKFVPVKRSIDTRFFPTWKKLEAMLAPYAAKQIGQSYQQIGDPTPRHVFHIRNRLPEAVLLMDDPYSGKSSISHNLFRPDLLRISGDVLYYEIMLGKREASPELKAIIDSVRDDDRLNCLAVTTMACRDNLSGQICSLVLKETAGRPFILDMAVPVEYRGEFRAFFDNNSFFVVEASIYGARTEENCTQRSDICQQYMEYLQQDYLIDEKAYLEANPSVAKAVATGEMPSAQFHYWNFGRREGRKLAPNAKEPVEKEKK